MNTTMAKLISVFIKDVQKKKNVYNILTNKEYKNSTQIRSLESKIDNLQKSISNLTGVIRATTDASSLKTAVGDLRLQQLGSLALLKNIIKFFETNNLIYWLEAGSLLGAVRHNGFIPWDDDIDIATTRECYEKLKLILPKLCKNGISYSEGDIIRIFYKDTSLQVDIFPFDSGNSTVLPSGAEYVNIVEKLQKIYNNIPFDWSDYRKSTIPEEYKFKLKEIYETEILQNKPIPDKAYMFFAPHCFTWKRVLCKYEEIFPLKKIKFEDTELFAPNNVYMHLHNYFGDFEVLPDKMGSHHGSMGKNFSEKNVCDVLDFIEKSKVL